jgi:hypothetical protein
MGRQIWAFVVALGLLATGGAGVSAQESTPHRQNRGEAIQARAFEAIEKGEYQEAERLLREQIGLQPRNFVPYYNLACVLSLQGNAAAAGDMLIAAVERGFIDLSQMRRDPHLAAARKDPAFRNLVSEWPSILEQHLEANLKHAQGIFDGRHGAYAEIRDEHLRVAYLSAMDLRSTEMAREDLARLYQWGLANVFADLVDDPAAKPRLSSEDPWVVVVLPAGKDFIRWAAATYGAAAVNNFSGIGGSYLHDQKRLVAQDLGATLRHEFFHVLHWRSMTRLGQDHPIWIQEGLCSLVEDYDCPDGTAASLRPVASWRTNVSRRLAIGGRLMPLQRLADVPRDRFTGSSPLANYGQARTVFLYLFEHGKLKDWYAHYTANFDADPSGIKSLEAVFEKPIAEIDREYRLWVRALPEVAEQLRPGAAGLGVDVEGGTGDGPVIVEIPRRILGKPNPAIASGLRLGDAITAIDGRPTRDLNELVRVLGEKQAGDEVEVSYRRGAVHGSVRVRLTRQ